MKKRSMVLVAALLVGSAHVAAAADSLNEALQKGLLEEEANHNLEAAIQAYQSVIDQYDDQKKLAATAVFRLGECYRKQGKTNEAVAQYQRILQEFSDQSSLLGPSERALVAMGRSSTPFAGAGRNATISTASDPERLELLKKEIWLVEQELAIAEAKLKTGKGSFTDLARSRKELLSLQRQLPENASSAAQKQLVEQQIKLVEQQLEERGKRLEVGAAAPGDEIPLQRELIGLQRELLAVSQAPPAGASARDAASPSSTEEEASEIQRIQVMVRNSPDLVNARDRNGYGPLHQAARKGQRAVADFLLANGASVDLRDNQGDTPLHLAVFYGHKAIVELLLSHRADVNAGSSSGFTPLHLAVERGFRLIAEVLLANGADVNLVCHDGNLTMTDPGGKEPFRIFLSSGTPLQTAVMLGKIEFAELLLARKPDVNVRDARERTAFNVAVQAGNVKLAERLLEAGAKVNVEDTLGLTPLHVALSTGNTEMVKWLLAHGANVNAKERQGFTPLHMAAGFDKTDFAELLLAHGAEVNPKDRAGETPLFRALRGNNKGMMEFLLTHGADPNVKNKENVTPMMITKFPGSKVNPVTGVQASADELAELLRKHGAKE